MGLPELVAPEERVDVQSLTQLILKERQKRLSLTQELVFEKQKITQLEDFINQMIVWKDSNTQINEIFKSDDGSAQIGAYPFSVRQMKIINYKLKVKKYRSRVKISRDFKGRSIAAKKKPRFNGKFAKKFNEDCD